jgi:hypothetical protein
MTNPSMPPVSDNAAPTELQAPHPAKQAKTQAAAAVPKAATPAPKAAKPSAARSSSHVDVKA